MTTNAFALAGLGGFNAHGAGFLAAARKHNFVPDLVTATSGQILVVAQWLCGGDLRKSLIDPQLESSTLAQMQVGLFGYRGVFRPAFPEAWARLWSPMSRDKDVFGTLADRLLPAQEYVPTRSDAEFERYASTLNSAQLNGKDIGVVFNAYDPRSGAGVLYGNDAARRIWPPATSLPSRPTQDVKYASKGRVEKELHPITPDALKAALWLSLYGFDNLPSGQMDGAYHRACIVSELHAWDRLFIARPLAAGWLKNRLPSNWFEVQDWQYEMWFSVGYKAELEGLQRINQLIELGHLNDPAFKKVELHEIAPQTPAGYFNYFVERGKVFHEAFDKADALFASI